MKHGLPCVYATAREESVQPDESSSSDSQGEGRVSEIERTPEFQEADDDEEPSKQHYTFFIDILTTYV